MCGPSQELVTLGQQQSSWEQAAAGGGVTISLFLPRLLLEKGIFPVRAAKQQGPVPAECAGNNKAPVQNETGKHQGLGWSCCPMQG